MFWVYKIRVGVRFRGHLLIYSCFTALFADFTSSSFFALQFHSLFFISSCQWLKGRLAMCTIDHFLNGCVGIFAVDLINGYEGFPMQVPKIVLGMAASSQVLDSSVYKFSCILLWVHFY